MEYEVCRKEGAIAHVGKYPLRCMPNVRRAVKECEIKKRPISQIWSCFNLNLKLGIKQVLINNIAVGK